MTEDGATYLVEYYWPGVRATHVAEHAAQIRDAAEATTVEYLGAVFVPDDDYLFILLRAPDPAEIHELVHHVRLPADRIAAVTLVGTDGLDGMLADPAGRAWFGPTPPGDGAAG